MPKTSKLPAENISSDGRQETPKEEVQKTVTNWIAFEIARLMPKEILCQGYKPTHQVDLSCHTRLPLDAAVLGKHIKAEHGGGFLFTLRKADKTWPGWRKFSALGLEAHDFRCAVCDAVVPFHPGHILKHMKPHTGKIKRITPGGGFNITLGFGLPDLPDVEAFESELEA